MTIATRRVARGLDLSEIGFGGAPLGNLYRPLSDAEARATLAAALAAGIRYVDTAPHYGQGLSERRVGDMLRGRADVVLSTKVGRLLRPDPTHVGSSPSEGFCSPLPFRRQYDYSHDGILRSHEDSLQRLGLASVDLLYVHDIGARTHGDDGGRTYAQLTQGGGLRALEELRAAGAIAGFGIGTNEWQVCLDVMRETDLDLILLAGRYTLLDQSAAAQLLPECQRRGVRVVIGGPYNSGILVTGTKGREAHYDYGAPPASVRARVEQLEALCARHQVPLAAAALQFPLAHPAVASVIPGLASVAQVEQTLGFYRTRIPPAFWAELRQSGLIAVGSPLPEGAD